MTLQIEFTWLVGLLIAFLGAVWAFGKVLVSQFDKRLDERFVSIKADLDKREADDVKVAEQLRQFEKEFLTFQRDMPIQYVRREDYIRGQTVIESKLDAVYSKLELVQIQGARHD